MPSDTALTCRRCSHAAEAHDHFRAGTECSLCDCPSYQPRSLTERVQRLVRRR